MHDSRFKNKTQIISDNQIIRAIKVVHSKYKVRDARMHKHTHEPVFKYSYMIIRTHKHTPKYAHSYTHKHKQARTHAHTCMHAPAHDIHTHRRANAELAP